MTRGTGLGQRRPVLARQQEYLDWTVGAFRLATAALPGPSRSTHMCYSEFSEIIAAICDMDADITSIEARSALLQLTLRRPAEMTGR